MNSCLSHVALLVNSVEASAAFLRSHGIKTQDPEVFESEGTKEIYAGDYTSQSGLLLLLEAMDDGPYRRAMNKRGASLHHLAVDVIDLEKFSTEAQRAGWKLHPISEQTISHKTIWLYSKGIPCLVEVHQKKELSSKPVQISSLELMIQPDQLPLFEILGLGDIVSCGQKFLLTVDHQKLDFNQLALVNNSLGNAHGPY